MGHKVNPVGLRLGVTRTWDSIWYEDKKNYAKYLHEDLAIKEYVEKEKKSAGISRVAIDRFPLR